jgi:nucleoid-associated protein YgaU
LFFFLYSFINLLILTLMANLAIMSLEELQEALKTAKGDAKKAILAEIEKHQALINNVSGNGANSNTAISEPELVQIKVDAIDLVPQNRVDESGNQLPTQYLLKFVASTKEEKLKAIVNEVSKDGGVILAFNQVKALANSVGIVIAQDGALRADELLRIKTALIVGDVDLFLRAKKYVKGNLYRAADGSTFVAGEKLQREVADGESFYRLAGLAAPLSKRFSAELAALYQVRRKMEILGSFAQFAQPAAPQQPVAPAQPVVPAQPNLSAFGNVDFEINE